MGISRDAGGLSEGSLCFSRGLLLLEKNEGWVVHTHEVLENLQSLESEVDAIESAYRKGKKVVAGRNRNVWSAAVSQAKSESDRLVCANVCGLRWSNKLLARMDALRMVRAACTDIARHPLKLLGGGSCAEHFSRA